MAKGTKNSEHAHGKRRPTPEGAAYAALVSTADGAKFRFEGLCAPFDITGQQYNVLRILRGGGPEGLPTLTIAERMIENTPGITRMIDRLEAKGLVARETSARDRRRVYCRVTEKGLSLLAQLDEPVREFNQRLFGGLSKAELEQLTALLTKTQRAYKTE